MEQQIVEDRIYKQAQRAAKSALVNWYSGQWVRQAEALDDLTQDLMVWYLERPSTQEKMSKLSDPEVMVTFRLHARQVLSDQQHEKNVSGGENYYSSDCVKSALKGESTNIYLQTILPYALERISRKYKSAVLSRYELNIVPPQGAEHNILSEAVRALTEEVNVICLTSTVENAGSRSVVFPDTIKPAANTSDETGNMALMLMDVHPGIVDEWHSEPNVRQTLLGEKVSPVCDFGPSGKYRLPPSEYEWIATVPAIFEMFCDIKEEQWHPRWDNNRPGQWWWTANAPSEEESE